MPIDGGFQLTSAKRKKDLRHSSSKRRRMNHKRKYLKNNVIEKSPEMLKTDEEESESTDSDVRRQCEVSDFNEKMSAWSGLGIASSILKALAEQGFVEPTEIQVRFRNQKYCVSFGVLSAMSLLGDVAMSFGRYVPTCCTSV